MLPSILLFILRSKLCSQSLQQQRVICIFFYSFDWGHLHAHEHIFKAVAARCFFLDWFDNVRIGLCIDVQPTTYWHSRKHCSYVAQGWNPTITLKKVKVGVSFALSAQYEPTLTLTLLLRLKDTFSFLKSILVLYPSNLPFLCGQSKWLFSQSYFNFSSIFGLSGFVEIICNC